MDLYSALLKITLSLGTAFLILIHSLLGNLMPSETPITILPERIASTTPPPSSSQSVIGSSTPQKISPPASPSKSLTKSVPRTSQSATSTLPAIDSEVLNNQTRTALVNILCISKGGGSIHSISGSGVFVDNRGVVLTNAHIGQYFLLKDYPTQGNVDCTIRTGSPAQNQYRATLIYLPPSWITANGSQILSESAMGTGEDDYAFLLVTSSTGPTPLPTSFPYLPMTIAEPDVGTGMFLAAYPAGFLGGIDIEKNLYASSAYAVVTKLFTFGENLNIDLVSIGGTVVSQGGSSGGAMVRQSDGELSGLIANATVGETTADRDLRAITLAHINRSLTNHDQGGITTLLSQDLIKATNTFASSIAPGELEVLKKIIKY